MYRAPTCQLGFHTQIKTRTTKLRLFLNKQSFGHDVENMVTSLKMLTVNKNSVDEELDNASHVSLNTNEEVILEELMNGNGFRFDRPGTFGPIPIPRSFHKTLKISELFTEMESRLRQLPNQQLGKIKIKWSGEVPKTENIKGHLINLLFLIHFWLNPDLDMKLGRFVQINA